MQEWTDILDVDYYMSDSKGTTFHETDDSRCNSSHESSSKSLVSDEHGVENRNVRRCEMKESNNKLDNKWDGNLRFALADKQIGLLNNFKNYEKLTKELTPYGTMRRDGGYLILTLKHSKSFVGAIHELEKTLGIMLSVEEIRKLMNDIGGNVDEINPNEKEIRGFVNKMMQTVTSGTCMLIHDKSKSSDFHRVFIQNNKLCWQLVTPDFKESKYDYMQLGTFATTMSQECFSIFQNHPSKVVMNLQCKNKATCNEWHHYLKGLNTHFAHQGNEFTK